MARDEGRAARTALQGMGAGVQPETGKGHGGGVATEAIFLKEEPGLIGHPSVDRGRERDEGNGQSVQHTGRFYRNSLGVMR